MQYYDLPLGELQPSGTANFSRIDRVEMNFNDYAQTPQWLSLGV